MTLLMVGCLLEYRRCTMYKAVIFDLFETLITEWGHRKYTKNELCADLGIHRAEFDPPLGRKGTGSLYGKNQL